MIRHKTVITGAGVVCSGGLDCDEFTVTLEEGSSALTPVSDPRIAHFGPVFAGTVEDMPDDTPFPDEDRYIRIAAKAADEAVEQANIRWSEFGNRAGLFFGTCSGPMLTIEEIYLRHIAGKSIEDPRLFKKKQYYHAANLLAGRYGISGPVCTTTTACSAFCTAFTSAADLIRTGILDVALVGGADSFSLTTLAGFAGLKAVSRKPCAPFSLPTGLSLGEGAGWVVIESQTVSAKRGARVIAAIEGYGLSNDAYHCSAPDPTGKGAAIAMDAALKDAAANPEDISYINAHGTGTEANDKAETKAIRLIFSGYGTFPPVSSTKAVTGHCLGGAGGVETVASLLCSQKGMLPPGVNFNGRREGCELDIPEKGRSWPGGGRWMKNNFAFGGNNASIILKNGSQDSGSNTGELPDDPIVISSVGILSSVGIGVPGSFSRPGECVGHATLFHGCWQVKKVPEFTDTQVDRRFSSRGMERTGKFAAASAALALKNGNIPDKPSLRRNIGIFMSRAQGSSRAEREHIESLLRNNFRIGQINTFPYIVPNAVTGSVTRSLVLTGHNTTFCNGCGAGLSGLVYAWAALRNGHTRTLLCGAVDDLSEEGIYDCVHTETGGVFRPVLGEGAAMCLLEPLSGVRERGVEPLGTILDVAFTNMGTDEKLLRDVIPELFEQHGIGSEETVILCETYGKNRKSPELLSFPNPVIPVDLAPLTGWMPASQPIINIAAVLDSGRIGNQKGAKYILTILCPPQGNITIVLLEKNVARKSVFSYD